MNIFNDKLTLLEQSEICQCLVALHEWPSDPLLVRHQPFVPRLHACPLDTNSCPLLASQISDRG